MGDYWLECSLTHNLWHSEQHCKIWGASPGPIRGLCTHSGYSRLRLAWASPRCGVLQCRPSASSPSASNLLSEQARPETQDDNDIYWKSHNSSLSLCSCKSLCNSLCLNKPFQQSALTKLVLPSLPCHCHAPLLEEVPELEAGARWVKSLQLNLSHTNASSTVVPTIEWLQ